MRYGFLMLFVPLLISGLSTGCNEELEEHAIPKAAIEQRGEASIELQGTIQLSFDDNAPGVGDVHWMGISPEETLLLTDRVGKQALEFDLDSGNFIRKFGGFGKGPGEYRNPEIMAIDADGHVYLIADSFLYKYDRGGRYIDKATYIGASTIIADALGEIHSLGVNKSGIMELQKRDPVTLDVLLRFPVTTKAESLLARRMFLLYLMDASGKPQRLYCLGPNDYLIKEIDAVTGQIIRQFGQRPEGFYELPHEASPSDMQDLHISRARSMTLLSDRFLVVSWFLSKASFVNESWTWKIFDLGESDAIGVYDFDERSKETLATFSPKFPWREIAAHQDKLFMWKPPSSSEDAEQTNGTVEVYTISFGNSQSR